MTPDRIATAARDAALGRATSGPSAPGDRDRVAS